jgi:flagellar hook-associated protein 1
VSQILEIARSAVMASRTALEVTAQNVANSQTPGYIRQRVSLAPVALSDPGGRASVGNGVTVQSIERLRNQCLEAQINHQEGQLGQDRARSDSLSRVEAYFGDLSGGGLSQSLGALFDALQKLQTAPASSVARGEVISAADSFARQTRTLSAQLTQERTLLGTELEQHVGQVNVLLHEVADLNGRIMPLGDNPQANDLKVSREETIRQLASLCGAGGSDQPGNAQDLLLGGLRLVQGTEVTELSLAPGPSGSTSQVVMAGAIEVDNLGGKIAGYVQAREQHLADWQQALDDLASSFADAVNTQHRAGVDLNNDAGGDVFAYDPDAAADTIRVSEALLGNSSLLAAAGVVGGPPGDGDNALNLLNLRQAKLVGGGTLTAEQGYEDLMYGVGVEALRASDATEARSVMVTSLDTQYANEAGVSLDEEGVEIMRFQQVFSASTRLLKIADEMIQDILGLAD